MQDITNNKKLQKDLASQVNEMMLGRLREIDGLDSVDWWPLAPIWWVIIGLFVTVIIGKRQITCILQKENNMI